MFQSQPTTKGHIRAKQTCCYLHNVFTSVFMTHFSVYDTLQCLWHISVFMTHFSIYNTFQCLWHVSVNDTFQCLWHISVSMTHFSVYDTFQCLWLVPKSTECYRDVNLILWSVYDTFQCLWHISVFMTHFSVYDRNSLREMKLKWLGKRRQKMFHALSTKKGGNN